MIIICTDVDIRKRTIDSGSELEHEVESPEDNVWLDQLVAVELPEEFQATESTLVHLGDVELQAKTNVLQYSINHSNNSIFLEGREGGGIMCQSCDYHMTIMKFCLMRCTLLYTYQNLDVKGL